MITFLIIYILGVIAVLWTIYHNLRKGAEIRLSELLCYIIESLFSWIVFFILLITIYGDEIVFKKK